MRLLTTTLIFFLMSNGSWAVEVEAEASRSKNLWTVQAVWTPTNVVECRRENTIGPDEHEGLTLIDRDVVRDEIGNTVHPEQDASAEFVQGDVWLKKEFYLDNPSANGAELCVLVKPLKRPKEFKGLYITFNGQHLPYKPVSVRARPYSGVYPADRFPEGHKLFHLNGKPFKEYWQGGWDRVPVDVKLLRQGTNTAIFRAPSGGRYKFLIEPSLHPNRSAVSEDGGATWDYDHLSRSKNMNGEYVVRLHLKRHPKGGWIESESVDLWPHEGAGPVATPSEILSVKLSWEGTLPDGSEIKLLARIGRSPTYHPAEWTPWTAGPDLAVGLAKGGPLSKSKYRFLQWRADLTSSDDQLKAPRLFGVKVVAELQPSVLPTQLNIVSCQLEQPTIVRPSHRFVHARNTSRLKLLRKQCKLDDVIKDKARGMAQLHALCAWIAKLRKEKVLNNLRGTLMIDTPWDGLLIWNMAKPGLTSRMCTHSAALFTQCATALGYQARVCIWSHAIAEVWVDNLDRWVAFDPSYGTYFEVDGQPASMLEVSRAWGGQIEGKSQLDVRQVWSSQRKSDPLPNSKLAWYTRFFVPMRSNYLESPQPSEAGHGRYYFKYDGHLRWLHPKKEPLPWFAFTTSRVGDLLFTLNSVNLHIARTTDPGKLSVVIDTDAPNVENYEARFNDGKWREVKRHFLWEIAPGTNSLAVRSVSTFQIPGRVAKAQVTVARP